MQGLWANYKKSVIHAWWDYQEEKKKEGTKKIRLRISPRLSDSKPQSQEAQETPSQINTKKPTPRHIVFKYRK